MLTVYLSPGSFLTTDQPLITLLESGPLSFPTSLGFDKELSWDRKTPSKVTNATV